MLSLVNAAEHQYRFDSAQLDRDAALRLSIREHEMSRAENARASTLPAAAPVVRVRRREAWARPIGVRLDRATACPAA